MKEIMINNEAVSVNSAGLFKINDLHKAAGGLEKDKPSNWMNTNQFKELRDLVEIAGNPAIVSNQGVGTYCCKELVYAYAMWISAAFHLRVIQAFDRLVVSQPQGINTIDKILAAQDIACRMMNLPESGKLLMLQQLNQKHGNLLALPSYGIDSGTVTSGSSEPTASATTLLKDHSLSAKAFNLLAQDAGYLEKRTRPSSKSGEKEYWSITELGLKFGKNVTAPSNPRETQPHWYVNKFNELVNELGDNHD